MTKFIILAVFVPIIVCGALQYWEGIAMVLIAWFGFAAGAGYNTIKQIINNIKNNYQRGRNDTDNKKI